MGSSQELKDHCEVQMEENTLRCKVVPSGYRTVSPVDTVEELGLLGTSMADDE